MVTLYGIRNCDSVRKARRWLDGHGIEYRFHDLREDGLDEALLNGWIRELGWEALINRRGTTWRRLPGEQRHALGPATVMQLMLANPSIIKRPVLDTGTAHHLGFSDTAYATLFLE